MAKPCLSCCSCLCCCLLVITNIVAMIIGALLVIIGVFLTFGFSMFQSVLSSTISSLTSSLTSSLASMNINLDISSLLSNISAVTGSMGAAFLVVGIIVLLLACFGCCGACCKSCRTCLLIYAGFVGIIFLAQVIIVIIWFANASAFKSSVKAAMEQSLGEYTGMDSMNIQSLMQNLIQIFIGCCGVTNGTDFYTMSPKWNRTFTMSSSGYNYTFNLTYPLTCCKFDTSSFKPVDSYCPYNRTNTNTSNYQKGCYNEIFTYIDGYFKLDTIFYVLGGILGFQALLFAGAIIIHRANDDSNKVKPN